MLESQEKRSEIISYQNKFKLKKVKFKEDGQLRQLISLIKWSKENHKIDLEMEGPMKLKIIRGLQIFHGKICMIKELRLHLYHL